MKLNPLIYIKHIVLITLIGIFSSILLWNAYNSNITEGLTTSSVYTPEQLAEIREISRIAYENVQKDTEKRLQAEIKELKRKIDVAGTIQSTFASITEGKEKESGKKKTDTSSMQANTDQYF